VILFRAVGNCAESGPMQWATAQNLVGSLGNNAMANSGESCFALWEIRQIKFHAVGNSAESCSALWTRAENLVSHVGHSVEKL
jgi:hypothetical protein